MRQKLRTLLSIAFPLQTRSQKSPRFIGFIPKSVPPKRILRESDDFRLILVNPCQAVVERYFVPLPVAVCHVDLQALRRSTLSKGLAFGEFKQGPSGIVRLRIDELRHGISPSAMIQLVRK
jgi:hypothetical protein